MPDPSFPESNSSNGVHSVVQTLIGVEQKSSFSSFTDATREPWTHSWQTRLRERQPEINTFLRPLTFHAEPLAPLRLRDEQALDEMFEDAQIEEIFMDICARLTQLYPEPCWDDQQFDFLRGYL